MLQEKSQWKLIQDEQVEKKSTYNFLWGLAVRVNRKIKI